MIQLPKMKLVELPSAVGMEDTSSAIEPVLVLEILKDVSGDRAGMLGIETAAVIVTNTDAASYVLVP
jgi:hypothetical protein